MRQISIIVAILSAGTVLGSFVAAPVGDIFGRRRSLIGSVGVFSFGVVFQVCAHNIALLLVGRFFAGVGVGIVSVLVPLYQSEMAPKWVRGTLVCAYQLSITIGLLLASAVNILTYRIVGAAAYRIPMGLQLTWACVLSLGLLVLPETPRYLIKRGQKEAAALSLSRLRRLDITHPALVEELAEIEANHEYELALGPDTYKDMLQQLTGVNFIMYYGTTFFEGAHVSNPFQISLIVQVINTVSTIPGLLVVESWGRRKLLIVGAIGMAVCQLLIASFTTVVGGTMPATASKILVIFVAIYIFFFAASWGPVTWVVTSEIYPLKVRAKSMSFSTASNWLLNFGIAYGTPYLVENGTGYANLGARVFFVWGAFCIVAVVFVWCMVYETSKISLEQIDEIFQQMRDFGFSDSGVQPQPLEPQQPLAHHQQQPPQPQSQPQPPLQPQQQQQQQQPQHRQDQKSASQPPPSSQHRDFETIRTSSTMTAHSDTAASGTSSAQDDKILAQMGHVDFSY
ncbi:hypothetical protein VTK73DRAFT_3896 [Phialemonium thermophilum]|uniref:Major facilitator superfamily (MFS) profile domain-containing protein n=1 Tax=Phialemonium thermophilum TaxID=223376 RepID=A0ABR3VDL5_9PEZI